MTEVKLTNLGDFKFECTNSIGKSAVLDGPAKIGGSDDGLRPMELILMGLGGCSVFDMVSILRKQRQEVEGIDVIVQGQRADATPAVYIDIKIIFEARGQVDPVKLKKAAALSVEKYCSVAAMLEKTAKISFETRVKEQ